MIPTIDPGALALLLLVVWCAVAGIVLWLTRVEDLSDESMSDRETSQ